MSLQPDEKTTGHIKTGFNLIKIKLHFSEICGDILDVVTRFHREIGHVLEHITKQLPAINMLVEALGHIAAIAHIRKKDTLFEKRALGLKFASGLVTTGIAIAAFAVPHLSLPLIVAGSASNLAYSYFNIYKTNYDKKKLEKEWNNLHENQHVERQHIEHKIEKLNERIAEHKEKITHKTVSTLTSTIFLLGLIVMLANPITIAPVSIILATTSAIYMCYHFRKPILSGLTRLGNAIKNIFLPSSVEPVNKDGLSDHPTQQPTHTPDAAASINHFLNQQQHILSQDAAAHSDTFQNHHTATMTHTTDPIKSTDFLHNTEQALASITAATMKEKITPTHSTHATQKIEVEEDEDEGGEGKSEHSHADDAEGEGGREGEADRDNLDSAEEDTRSEPNLHL